MLALTFAFWYSLYDIIARINKFVIMLIAMIMFKITFECGANISPMALITNKTMLVAVNILMKLSLAAIIRSIADISRSVYMCIPFTKNYITHCGVG